MHGIQDNAMKRHPLEEQDLTLKQAIEIITGMEAATKGTQQPTSYASTGILCTDQLCITRWEYYVHLSPLWWVTQ